nr:hypothetical protein [Tanacetum cinerariifolium]
MSRKSAQNMSSNAEVTYSKGKVHPFDDGSQPRTLCKHGFRHVRCEEYRIFRDHTYMIELDGATSMRKASVKSGGFVRYPLQLISLGSIKLTDDTYLIGNVLSVNKDEVSLSQAAVYTDYSQAKEGTLGHKKNGTSHPAMAIDYPVLRFQLELYISDKTASTIVVMFDEPEKELLKCFADFLAVAYDESGFGYADHAGLPLALTNIIGTTHTLEMKSHTYYEHGSFESFTEELPVIVLREELKDSTDEVTGDMDDGGVDGKKSSLTDKRKKK